MKILKSSVLLFVFLTILTGVVYPLVVTGVAQLFFKGKANGSLSYSGNKVQGSKLIGQNFTDPSYFWPRPSSTDYSTLLSGASNLGPTSESLKQKILEREMKLSPYIASPIPVDLLMASGSGLDPDINPEAALAQIDHVSKARALTNEQISQLEKMVKEITQKPQYGIFGAPRVNVYEINLTTDKMFGKPQMVGENR
jgi:potassium-transporting ATPase KdpC subunit